MALLVLCFQAGMDGARCTIQNEEKDDETQPTHFLLLSYDYVPIDVPCAF